MSVLVDSDTRVIIQGLGKTGQFHTDKAIAYGTQMVGRRPPQQGGRDAELHRVKPITPVSRVGPTPTGWSSPSSTTSPRRWRRPTPLPASSTSRHRLPPTPSWRQRTSDVGLIVCITEGIPVQDMVKVRRFLEGRPVRLVGPNCPGVITPKECKIGIMPGYIHQPGRIGVVSRSGTLTYEAVWQLTQLGLGQTTAIGIGGDPVNGTNFLDALGLFNDDPATEGVLMIGEIGGTAEEDAAAWVAENMDKPVAGLHRRDHRSPGKADGSCRGDHLRRQGHSRRQDRRHGERRDRRGPNAHPDGGGDGRGAGRIRTVTPRHLELIRV